ncbi:MAG: HAD-IIA family hydrolase [Pseudomonadota bacterium]|nr:HAD-IIA family hydrolase [Pseudomonadota bacterium]
MSLHLNEIIDIYEQSRPWYDEKPYPQTTKKVSGLKDCLENVDLVLLDSYGVLCRGREVIPQALTAIAELQQKGVAFCVVSNDTMNGWRTVEQKYQKLGFDFSADEIVTSLDVTEKFLEKQQGQSSFAATCYGNNPIAGKFPQIADLNTTAGVLPKNAENLMYLVGASWDDDLQKSLIESAQGVQDVYLANPDVGAPSGDVFVKTPGFYAHDFYNKTNHNRPPILLGKPAACMFEHALEFMGYQGKAENVLMVGDTLHTDILGANNMGFQTLLVESGLFIGGEAEHYIQKTGIKPNFMAPTL